MEFVNAWARASLAARELGGDFPGVVARIAPDALEWLTAQTATDEIAGRIALGVAVGRIEAEQPAALAALAEIEREWRQSS